MSDASNVARSLRERLSGTTEERLGRALSDLLENPVLTGAIGRAFDAREKAAQAQEVAMGALNIPSAADIERLTRRLRSVSLRLEGIEEGVDRLEGAIASPAAGGAQLAERLSAIEGQLRQLTDTVQRVVSAQGAATAPAASKAAGAAGTGGGGGAKAAKTPKATKASKAKRRKA